MAISVTEPNKRDAYELFVNLRALDRREIAALSGVPEHKQGELIEQIVAFPGTMCARDDAGNLVAVFGCYSDTLTFCGNPWMLGTNAFAQNKLACTKLAKRYISEWLSAYGRLENTIWADNDPTIRWLSSLGFTIGPVYYGMTREPLRKFWMEAA